MNNSERLLSAFSEKYFFQDLVMDDLKFTPPGTTEKELADLVVNLGDTIIAVQLKARDDAFYTHDKAKETTWLAKRCRDAKKQVKESIEYIKTGLFPEFCNKRGVASALNPGAKVVPLVVFDNVEVLDYPHLLRKHSEDGMNINCMSFADYQQMCHTLVTPMEIVQYLEYRESFYEENGDPDIVILEGLNDELLITRPRKQEALVFQFLTERYTYKDAKSWSEALPFFQNFLHMLPDRITMSSSNCGALEIIRFLSHLNRAEISAFCESMISTQIEAKDFKAGILHSLRTDDFVILFIANKFYSVDELLAIVEKHSTPKRMLALNLYWISEEKFNLNFMFWEKP